MTRKAWLGIALVAGLCAAAVLLLASRPRHPAPVAMVAVPAPTAVAAARADTMPPAVTATEAPRPAVTYDHYRRELDRIRASRRAAQDLKANERCLDGQRYRKAGNAWELVGPC